MPRIQMTRSVKVALYGLRIYLIVLLSLIGLKFVRDFLAHPEPKEYRAAQLVVFNDPLLTKLMWCAEYFMDKQVPPFSATPPGNGQEVEPMTPQPNLSPTGKEVGARGSD